ncbi:hypothetical protein FB45DRAFT_1115521, partial [Roridomyces roridus]
MNPFAQGWSNGSSYQHVSRGPTPSVYGFLPQVQHGHAQPPPRAQHHLPPPPQPAPPPMPNLLSFTFSSPNNTPLNSTVTSGHGQRYFRITTDSTTAGFSLVQNTRQECVAMIEWRKHPVVELIGLVSKRNSGKWLALSPDKSCRLMTVQGRHFGWIPDGRYISVRGATCFELTSEAIELGLLEVFVVSALLLMCGRNID